MTAEHRIHELKTLIESSPLRRTLEHDAVHSIALHPSCGDSIYLSARIINHTVTEIGVSGEGCLLSKAAGILTAHYILGKKVAEIAPFSDDIIIALLDIGTIGPTRRRCISVATEALKKLGAIITQETV